MSNKPKLRLKMKDRIRYQIYSTRWDRVATLGLLILAAVISERVRGILYYITLGLVVWYLGLGFAIRIFSKPQDVKKRVETLNNVFRFIVMMIFSPMEHLRYPTITTRCGKCRVKLSKSQVKYQFSFANIAISNLLTGYDIKMDYGKFEKLAKKKSRKIRKWIKRSGGRVIPGLHLELDKAITDDEALVGYISIDFKLILAIIAKWWLLPLDSQKVSDWSEEEVNEVLDKLERLLEGNVVSAGISSAVFSLGSFRNNQVTWDFGVGKSVGAILTLYANQSLKTLEADLDKESEDNKGKDVLLAVEKGTVIEAIMKGLGATEVHCDTYEESQEILNRMKMLGMKTSDIRYKTV